MSCCCRAMTTPPVAITPDVVRPCCELPGVPAIAAPMAEDPVLCPIPGRGGTADPSPPCRDPMYDPFAELPLGVPKGGGLPRTPESSMVCSAPVSGTVEIVCGTTSSSPLAVAAADAATTCCASTPSSACQCEVPQSLDMRLCEPTCALCVGGSGSPFVGSGASWLQSREGQSGLDCKG